MPSSESVGPRRAEILRLLALEPSTLTQLQRLLRPTPSERNLRKDIAALKAAFPGRLVAERQGHAKVWRFLGEAPRPLVQPLLALDEDQIAAIIAARGVLRMPDPDDTPVERTGTHYHGPLATALDRLLCAAGLEAEARAITPDAVAISRFGAAPVADHVFPTAFGAIRTGESLRFAYTNLDSVTHPVHGKAICLAHIAGEWHLLAWAPDGREPPGKLKQYRLSRMATVTRVATPPPGCPLSGLRAEAADHLRDAFRATGSTRSDQRCRVELAFSPKAWPFIDGRRWGAKQKVEHAPAKDLPAGWRRLRFVTTGIAECRHWVLGFGAEVRAEHPPELVAWLREQAGAILASTGVTANTAAKATGLGDRVPR